MHTFASLSPALPRTLGAMLTAAALLTGCPNPDVVTDAPMGGNPPPGGMPGQEGGGGQPGGGRPEIAGFAVEAGQGVTLSGTIIYAGTQTGTLRIDFLQKGKGGSFPELVHTLTLDKPGPWSVEAPKDLGDLSIVSFLDSNNNGPGPGEAAGMIESTTVGSVPVSNLDITLSDQPNLGAMTPPTAGAQPQPDGVGGPPPGGQPPDGAGGPGGPPPGGQPPGGPGGQPPGGQPPGGPGGQPPGGQPPGGQPPGGQAPGGPGGPPPGGQPPAGSPPPKH